jgi:hypothetical protein
MSLSIENEQMILSPEAYLRHQHKLRGGSRKDPLNPKDILLLLDQLHTAPQITIWLARRLDQLPPGQWKPELTDSDCIIHGRALVVDLGDGCYTPIRVEFDKNTIRADTNRQQVEAEWRCPETGQFLFDSAPLEFVEKVSEEPFPYEKPEGPDGPIAPIAILYALLDQTPA